jgi:ATP sulfurylase
MKQAMERTNADGLLIQPVVGPKKKGDFAAEAILGAYDIFIKSCIPGALLCTFSTYSRYSGPREAVFTALCRKNYGCTHFIVGRDHTGVGDYYKQISNNELFDKLGDVGIKIVYFDKVGYSKSLGKMVEKDGQKQNDDIESISGTKIRDALLNDNTIPNTFIRKNIMEFLKERMDNDTPVFVE